MRVSELSLSLPCDISKEEEEGWKGVITGEEGGKDLLLC